MRQTKQLLLVSGLVAMSAALAFAGENADRAAAKANQAMDKMDAGIHNAAANVKEAINNAKDDFRKDAQATADEADKLAARLEKSSTGAKPTKDNPDLAQNLKEQASAVRSKLAIMDAAAGDAWESARKDAADELDKLQNTTYEAAAKFKDARQEQEKSVRAELNEIKQDISSLQANAAASAPAMKDDYNDTAKKLQDKHADATKKLAQLSSASGAQWADIRKELDEIVDASKQAYWDTIQKGSKAG